MKIQGREIDRGTIRGIAYERDLHHSDACRDANRQRCCFRCACDFFARIASHLPAPPSDDDVADARINAQRYIDEGYQQRSRKYCRVAKVIDGRWDDDGAVELSPTVFVAFRDLAGPWWERAIALREAGRK